MYQSKYVKFILKDNCNRLIISFGGICNGLGFPMFEFLNLMEDVSINKVFIIDIHQAWYHLGIDNIISTQSKLIDYLRVIINMHGREHTIFYGNSMGGYAAIKYGNLLAVDTVVAFSPQVFLSTSLRSKYKDTRWASQINNLRDKASTVKLDIHKQIKTSDKTTFKIHASLKDELDIIHASLIKYLPNVIVYEYLFGGHSLVKELKKINDLKEKIIGNL